MNTSPWRKSSRSSGNGQSSACVEARSYVGRFELRDSKLGDRSPIFAVTNADFVSLLDTIKR